ncbi:uncharacterized protein TM35_000281160 [Trypanosoma theileri]|uniref:Uncharacterized protein n=1 Tax=Trypanosoma theileri TaxID=67003 RepID=A0A1X0NQK0_9TRYP|nr:uncharacterized protein TM35_000281160 [Trypanosoma theileri]ORC86400.1 hypothetical protein TM35_000281160 [Trypanosoma theileri]
MPYVTTPFFLALKAGEELPLRPRKGAEGFSFTTLLTSLVFTRRCGKEASIPSTLSLVVCCDDVNKDKKNSTATNSYTLASHTFTKASGGDVSADESVVVSLPSPILLTSRGNAFSLVVKSTDEKSVKLSSDSKINGTAEKSPSTAYEITMHGSQRTFLTNEQMQLLSSAGRSL